MRPHLLENLARELGRIAADLEGAKSRGAAKAAELGRTDAMSVEAFEKAWLEQACKEAANRLLSIGASFYPKKRTRAA